MKKRKKIKIKKKYYEKIILQCLRLNVIMVIIYINVVDVEKNIPEIKFIKLFIKN